MAPAQLLLISEEPNLTGKTHIRCSRNNTNTILAAIYQFAIKY